MTLKKINIGELNAIRIIINTSEYVISLQLSARCLASRANLNSERKATEPMCRTSINYDIFCDVNEYCILSYLSSVLCAVCPCVIESIRIYLLLYQVQVCECAAASLFHSLPLLLLLLSVFALCCSAVHMKIRIILSTVSGGLCSQVRLFEIFIFCRQFGTFLLANRAHYDYFLHSVCVCVSVYRVPCRWRYAHTGVPLSLPPNEKC